MLEMKSLVSLVRVYISSLIANFSNIFNMPKKEHKVQTTKIVLYAPFLKIMRRGKM